MYSGITIAWEQVFAYWIDHINRAGDFPPLQKGPASNNQI